MNDSPIDRLILSGAVEVAGVDMETGEFLYTFTEKLAQFSPPLHRRITNYIHNELMFLWENGFIEMDIAHHNPTVRLTEKALDETKTRSLSPDKLASLKEVISIIMRDKK